MNCKNCGCYAPFSALWYCYTCSKVKEFAEKDVSKLIKKQKNDNREYKDPKQYAWEHKYKEWKWVPVNWQKESDWKLSYELDWYFIEAMAKRMSQNKWKYPPYNRQKPMDIEELKQALFRHTIEVMNWNYTDIEDNDHLQAIALNAMFIYYQLTNPCTK